MLKKKRKQFLGSMLDVMASLLPFIIWGNGKDLTTLVSIQFLLYIILSRNTLELHFHLS